MRELHPCRGHAVGVEGGLPLSRRAGRDERFHAGAEVLVVAHLLGAVRERALMRRIGEPDRPHHRALQRRARARRDGGIPRRIGPVVDVAHRQRAHLGGELRLLGVRRAFGPHAAETVEQRDVLRPVGGDAKHRVVLEQERRHEQRQRRPRRPGPCSRGAGAPRRCRRRASSRTCSRRPGGSPAAGRPSRSRPLAAISPLRAWMTRSMPASIASGPRGPNAVTLPTMRRG